MTKLCQLWSPILLLCLATVAASAQSFRVQCPSSTITHPNAATSEPPYNGPTVLATCGTPGAPKCQGTGGYEAPKSNVNGAIKCQQISGGDGYSTMADGTQTYMFSFGPLSGLSDIAAGSAGTEFPDIFNTVYPGSLVRGDPATTDGATSGASPGTLGSFTYNGAVGLTGNPDVLVGNSGGARAAATLSADQVTDITVTNPGTGCTFGLTGGLYTGPPSVTVAPPTGPNPTTALASATVSPGGCISGITLDYTGSGYVRTPTVTIGPASNACVVGLLNTSTHPPSYGSAPAACLTGHVDPRPIIDVGVMNGNIPAPLIAFDEDDEFFLTLTNVGMIMRPDLFEQHTVHFHGYPNASSFYDGVPDASVAINIGGSFTYYYLAPDAGTYFWHCHITPPEHLQMGMVGQLYVRPRQDRLPSRASLYTGLTEQQGDLRTACRRPGDGLSPAVTEAPDILCSTMLPAVNTGATQGLDKLGNPQKYVYNDGDGSTAYDVEYPIQMHGFDPNFHFVGMTFNPEAFVDMTDKYFLLNGRSYPDTVGPTSTDSYVTGSGDAGQTITPPGPQATMSSDGQMHYSQPLPAIINIPVGGKAALRLVNLSVVEYFTLQTLGVPMHVVGWNAKLLRDQAGNNTEYWANSITLGGGESNDVILDASDTNTFKAGQVFYLYEPDLYRLSNDAENFGGMLTEVHICSRVTGGSTFGNTCVN